MEKIIDRLIEIATGEIGYCEKETNSQLDHPTANAGNENFTKYARDLHQAGYYQANKQGYDWCDMFVDWCFLQLCGSREAAEKVQCQTGPYGAGCGWSARYYKNQGRLFHKYPQRGDQCFFRDKSHTGIITRVDHEYIYTIEGNTGNQVAPHRYRLDDPYVDHDFGRPLWELVPGAGEVFLDVPSGAWYRDALDWATEHGVVAGVGRGKFAPDLACRRADVLTMIWAQQGKPDPFASGSPFKDVGEDDYFFKPVMWAVEKGLTKGTGAGKFSPNQTCTRGQMVTFLWRLAGSPEAPEGYFSDLSKDDYCVFAANWACQHGVAAGIYEGHFGPNEPVTRAMVVQMLYKYSQL